MAEPFDPDPTFDRAAIKAWLKVDRADDDGIFDTIAVAVTSLVESLPDVRRQADLTWAAATHTAALMLAARLYRRRNSPSGVEAFTDQGAAYVSRYDPDIARLLRVDGYAPPRVG